MAHQRVHSFQLQQRDTLLSGQGEDLLLLVEHPPTITLGRRATADSLRVSEAEIHRSGVDLRTIERGGEATFHGPGQLVGYPVVRLASFRRDVPAFVAGLEEAMILFLAELGIEAGRREGHPGVWVGQDKVGAVGIHIRRFVSIHGFALNLTIEPEAFSSIVPCGIRDGGVTSVKRLLGRAPSPQEAAPQMAKKVGEVLGARLERIPSPLGEEEGASLGKKRLR